LLIQSDFWITWLTLALFYAYLGQAWNLLGGYGGQFSFGHALFFGTGAYCTAILQIHFHINAWGGFVLATVAGGLIGAGTGWLVFRYGLRGSYFALVTLAFAEVLKTVVKSLPFAVAGGSVGTNLPPLFRPVFVAGEMERWEVAFLRNRGYFLVYLGLLALAVLVSVLVQRSRLRYAFTAVRTNEAVAGVMGVNPARTKLVAFVISSVIVGMLGAIEAHRFGSVNPDATFSVHTTVLALVTPIFGGLYTTVGPILAALVLSGVEETLKRTLADGYLVAYGVVLVVSVLFMPRGLVGLLRGLVRRERARRAAAAPRAEALGGRDA